MPHALTDDKVRLAYEETGAGTPIVFVHEFAGDATSWRLQLGFFGRRYRAIAYNARGYPPSDVPEDPVAYSQRRAADDIRCVLDHLAIAKAHVVGLSMGGYATLHFGLSYPERALSLTVAGCGYGSGADRETFRQEVEHTVRQFEEGGMARVAEFYTKGPTRVQFLRKDPRGWREFYDQFVAGDRKSVV